MEETKSQVFPDYPMVAFYLTFIMTIKVYLKAKLIFLNVPLSLTPEMKRAEHFRFNYGLDYFLNFDLGLDHQDKLTPLIFRIVP